MALAVSGCSQSVPAPNLSLQVVPDTVVSSSVMPLLPEGAVLARSASRASIGPSRNGILAVWALREPLRFAAGLVQGGKLHPFPPLHEEHAPDRIGGVLLVQIDADPAGEVVILLDRSESRPDRNLATARQRFESVVIDYRDNEFVRDAALEALVAGRHRPNEIRELLEKGASARNPTQ
jgi:hypothetical protein